MIDGMSDFRDYYSGMGHFSLDQMFIAEPCQANNYCVRSVCVERGSWRILLTFFLLSRECLALMSLLKYDSLTLDTLEHRYFIPIAVDTALFLVLKDFAMMTIMVSILDIGLWVFTTMSALRVRSKISHFRLSRNFHIKTHNVRVRPIVVKDFWVRSVETCVQVL
jgi:hypothetical protein